MQPIITNPYLNEYYAGEVRACTESFFVCNLWSIRVAWRNLAKCFQSAPSELSQRFKHLLAAIAFIIPLVSAIAAIALRKFGNHTISADIDPNKRSITDVCTSETTKNMFNEISVLGSATPANQESLDGLLLKTTAHHTLDKHARSMDIWEQNAKQATALQGSGSEVALNMYHRCLLLLPGRIDTPLRHTMHEAVTIGDGNGMRTEQLNKALSNLLPNKKLLVRAGVPWHTVYFTIENIRRSSYRFTLYNSGLGSWTGKRSDAAEEEPGGHQALPITIPYSVHKAGQSKSETSYTKKVCMHMVIENVSSEKLEIFLNTAASLYRQPTGTPDRKIALDHITRLNAAAALMGTATWPARNDPAGVMQYRTAQRSGFCTVEAVHAIHFHEYMLAAEKELNTHPPEKRELYRIGIYLKYRNMYKIMHLSTKALFMAVLTERISARRGMWDQGKQKSYDRAMKSIRLSVRRYWKNHRSLMTAEENEKYSKFFARYSASTPPPKR